MRRWTPLPLELARPETLWRIDVPCSSLGWTPPPCPVRLEPGTDAWLVRSLPGRMDLVARWLHACGAEADVEGGLNAEAAVARFSSSPWPDDLAVRGVLCVPEGVASLLLDGTEEEADVACRRIEAAPASGHVRPVEPAGTPLSMRQRTVLDAAVALGYYEVPRRIGLRDLATRLGMSHGALSEILRRAEGRLARAHCDDWRPGRTRQNP